MFEKRCNQALKDLAGSRNEPLFLKQLLRDRTDIPAWLVPGRSVCWCPTSKIVFKNEPTGRFELPTNVYKSDGN
ncbi:MAG: hypothetical protein E6I68_00215 [Chloroflexi bacterium]|nr:MAG: hypothetical protein E6I68_00215 [Chloroflexota bacterium]